jgi:hypothetical protein
VTVTEGIPMDGGMTALCVNQSKVFVASEYRVVITTSIPVNRIVRRLGRREYE